jgi:hypothetical protein
MTVGKLHEFGTHPTTFIGPNDKAHDIDKYTRNKAFQCEDCGTLVLQGRFADADSPEDNGPYRSSST